MRSFDEYLKNKGLAVVGEAQANECADVSQELLERIYRERKVLVPWLARAALFIRSHAKDIKSEWLHTDVADKEAETLARFLGKLKAEGLVSRYDSARVEDKRRFVVAFPSEKNSLQFFRSRWAEVCFRILTKDAVRSYLKQTKQELQYRLRHNVKICRLNDDAKQVLTELDLVLEIADRFYVIEVKSGPWIRILQWAKREMLFQDSKARVITCTTYPGISPEIFKPQILLTLDSFNLDFLRILEEDLKVKTPTTLSKESMWAEHETHCDDSEWPEDEVEMVDTRTLAERLNQDVFHMRMPGDPSCHLVAGDNGEHYADYDLNACLDN